MDQEMEKLWKKFSLTEEEQDVIDLDSPISEAMATKYKRCVVGRLLSGKPFNAKALHSAMTGAWRISGGFEISEVGKSIFVCEFSSVRDKLKILREAPWHYDRQLIILAELTGDEQPAEMKLESSPFWVRLCNVPLNCRDRASIIRIAGRAGTVLEVRDEDVNTWGKHLRVRIQVNVTSPLKRGVMVRNKNGDKVWVYFRFERMPNYCYWCGHIGHVHDDCEVIPDDIETKDWPYSPAMRASPFRRVVGSRSSESKDKQPAESGASENESVQAVRRVLQMDEEGTTGEESDQLQQEDAGCGKEIGDQIAEKVAILGLTEGRNTAITPGKVNDSEGRVIAGSGSGGLVAASCKRRSGSGFKRAKAAARKGIGTPVSLKQRSPAGGKRKIGLQLVDESGDVVMRELCPKKTKMSLADSSHGSLEVAETAEQSRRSL
ncbi:uncharacterized protein LOC126661587 [Mercurialis annua]|uniref:uncharacterized protein LOC126661587 n=1 Tax=Mercurialis annua TaxID=3986 RepID=UPI00215F93CD|nr:uncharacterized protein LOC126661587 [Mercurialis annua]